MTPVRNMLWKPQDSPPVQSPSGGYSPSAVVHGTVLSSRGLQGVSESLPSQELTARRKDKAYLRTEVLEEVV